VLTARDSTSDRIAGLDAGADDYLVKPFDVDELQARMRALLRRSFQRSQPRIVHGEVSLDPASHEVSYQGQPVVLQRKEYLLLHQMLCQPGKVHTRDRLVQVLYGWDEEVESNALDVHIHHLRKKLHPELIRTVRGVGYIMDKAP
jgi:two-component system response regulator QseB